MAQFDALARLVAIDRRLSMALTTSLPPTTLPNAVYLPSSDGAGPVQMKNDVEALAGSSARAIETMPATCAMSLNSGCRLWT